jgi:DNA primase
VKEKKMVISQLVSETILSLRTYLINEKVKELQEETKNKSKNNNEILEEITDYHKLKSLLSNKLNRVL